MASPGNIPNSDTLNSKGIGENINNPSTNNPTLEKVGPFCQLATGIATPITNAIQSTIAAINGLQGALENILYAPARGLQELQRKILSGEILNDVTLAIQYSIGNFLTNAAKSLATSVAMNKLTTLASNIGKKLSTSLQPVANTLRNTSNKIYSVGNAVQNSILKAEAQLAAGVFAISQFPGDAILAVGKQFSGVVGNTLIDLGYEVNTALGQIVKTAASDVQTLTRGVFSPVLNILKTQGANAALFPQPAEMLDKNSNATFAAPPQVKVPASLPAPKPSSANPAQPQKTTP